MRPSPQAMLYRIRKRAVHTKYRRCFSHVLHPERVSSPTKHRAIFCAPANQEPLAFSLAPTPQPSTLGWMHPCPRSPANLLFSSSISGRGAWSIRVIDPQSSTIRLLTLQLLHPVHRALDINEIGMCETSGLSGSSINGDTHIDHIADATE
jgi:hypothetical protein